MRQALTVLTDELRRLKASGVKSVVVSDASVEALRRTIEWERANPPAYEPAQFDYAAEDAALAG